MMNDTLKDLVNEQRGDFEVHTSDYDSLWENVTRELDKRQRRPLSFMMKIAAGLVILAVSSILAYTAISWESQRSSVALYQVSPEMKETEKYYLQLINDRMEELRSYPEIENAAAGELATLDSLYNELQNDLADNVDNEEVVSAMIQNYRLKLELLENILFQIREKKGGNETEKDIEEDVEEYFL